MLYLSTRGHPDRKHFCDILLEGLAPDGGLYLPEHYPQVDGAMLTRLATSDPQHRVPHLAFQPGQMRDVSVLPMELVVTSYYLRLRVKDEAGVLSNVTRILADGGISINAVLQREADDVAGTDAGAGEPTPDHTDLIILTHDTREGTMDQAIAQMQALPTVLATITRIRKEELN